MLSREVRTFSRLKIILKLENSLLWPHFRSLARSPARPTSCGLSLLARRPSVHSILVPPGMSKWPRCSIQLSASLGGGSTNVLASKCAVTYLNSESKQEKVDSICWASGADGRGGEGSKLILGRERRRAAGRRVAASFRDSIKWPFSLARWRLAAGDLQLATSD